MTKNRKLVYDFLELPHVIRLDIVIKLGLIENGDSLLTETNRNTAYFRRATEANKVEKLREAVKEAHDVR